MQVISSERSTTKSMRSGIFFSGCTRRGVRTDTAIDSLTVKKGLVACDTFGGIPFENGLLVE